MFYKRARGEIFKTDFCAYRKIGAYDGKIGALFAVASSYLHTVEA
jgi:hypothetical protein